MISGGIVLVTILVIYSLAFAPLPLLPFCFGVGAATGVTGAELFTVVVPFPVVPFALLPPPHTQVSLAGDDVLPEPQSVHEADPGPGA